VPVRIVTDSSCDLTAAEAEGLGIEIVPLSIRFGADEFQDRSQLSVEDFYRLMAERPELPETAAPAPGTFEAAFRRQVAAGADQVLCINLSSDLSATMQSAQNGAKAADDIRVTVFDSKSITAGLGTMVLEAARLAADGADTAAIVAHLETLRAGTRVMGALDTLDNLKKGGRIGGAQAMIGSLLSIKPVIDISTGKVEEFGKARTRKKALAMLRDELFKRGTPTHVSVFHGMAPDVDDFLDMISDRLDPSTVRTGMIGAVIGTHGGPRVMGCCWIES
jgi:DegV family protein with EDD domain